MDIVKCAAGRCATVMAAIIEQWQRLMLACLTYVMSSVSLSFMLLLMSNVYLECWKILFVLNIQNSMRWYAKWKYGKVMMHFCSVWLLSVCFTSGIKRVSVILWSVDVAQVPPSMCICGIVSSSLTSWSVFLKQYLISCVNPLMNQYMLAAVFLMHLAVCPSYLMWEKGRTRRSIWKWRNLFSAVGIQCTFDQNDKCEQKC